MTTNKYSHYVFLQVNVNFDGTCQKKHSKYGIKFWVARNAPSSYAWKIQVYLGKPAGERKEKRWPQGSCLTLLRGSGVTTCDNIYTLPELGQELLTRKLDTVRQTGPELPFAFVPKKDRGLHSSKCAFTANTVVLSYMAKKNVLLVSTTHSVVSNLDMITAI